jgi:putative transposase
MPRPPRIDVADMVYHVINRANKGAEIFQKESDYRVFEELLEDAVLIRNIQIISFCIMPNHWHLVLKTSKDGQLGDVLRWITTTHATRWHSFKGSGGGHLYQGRYKSFVVETNNYLLQLIRYVERNPVRAGLVERAEEWKHSSLFRRKNNLDKWLSDTIIKLPKNYFDWVNEKELNIENLRRSVNKGTPFGCDKWIFEIVDGYKLDTTVRKRGRPRNIIQ